MVGDKVITIEEWIFHSTRMNVAKTDIHPLNTTPPTRLYLLPCHAYSLIYTPCIWTYVRSVTHLKKIHIILSPLLYLAQNFDKNSSDSPYFISF